MAEGIFEGLDADQAAAVRLRRNGAVSAGAGSGKTTVLAARYLDLILGSGADVASILCLTFTRKAAAEMRSRVWKELARHPDPRAAAAAARFAEASISTIDAFSGQLLRSSAQLYGYPPDFRVDDRAARELAEAEALRFLLERRELPALAELFAMLDFQTAWKDLFAGVAHRFACPARRTEDDLRAMPARALDALLRLSREALGAIGNARAEALAIGGSSSKSGSAAIAAFRALPADLADALPGSPLPDTAAAGAGAAGVGGARPVAAGGEPVLAGAEPVAAGIVRLATALAVILPFTGAFASIHLKFGKSDSELRLKAATALAKEAAIRLSGLAEAVRLRPLEDAIVAELADFVDLVLDRKRQAGLMTFRDVQATAVDLLASRPAIRAWWKDRFRYIMVDEFQDDDELQKELLFLLAETPGRERVGIPDGTMLTPDKLFFVGDDKQSIYRFRGADVSVFNRLGRELAGDGGSEPPPRLRTNYRSEPGLVDFFNRLFSRVLAPAAGGSAKADGSEDGDAGATADRPPVRDFEARFERALSRSATPEVEAGVTLLWKAAGDDQPSGMELRSDDEALADALVRHLKALKEGGTLLVPGARAARAAEWDDFAILLRTGSKQYLLERFLRLHGVPYSAASARGLFVEAPACDLFATLRLALYPADRASLAAFLRSPFARLTDEAFVEVLAASLPEGPGARGSQGSRGGLASRGGFENLGSLAGMASLDLSAADRRRLEAALDLLREIGERADRIPLAELVSWLWYERGQRLSILGDPTALPFLEHFDWLFALAADSDRRGENLAGFLARLGPLVGSPEKLEDELPVPREAARGLRIMTIHGSKGLEFPVVVLPWLESGGMREGKGESWHLSEEAGLTLNLRPWDRPGAKKSNVFFDAAKELEDARALAETKRLFYVACTRASTRLVLAAVQPSKQPPETSFLAFLGADVGPNGELSGLLEGVDVRPAPALDEESYLRLWGRKGHASPAAFLEPWRAAEILDRSRPAAILPATAIAEAAWAVDPRRALVAPALPDSAYDTWAGLVPENHFGDLCHAVLEARIIGSAPRPEHPAIGRLPDEARASLLAEAERLAGLFLDSPTGMLLSSARAMAVEKALLLAVGTSVLRCRLDLLVETGEGEFLVVDWKSGRERRSAEHEVQQALYRRAVAALHPGRTVRSLIAWLRSGEVEEVTADFEDGQFTAWAASVAGGPVVREEGSQ